MTGYMVLDGRSASVGTDETLLSAKDSEGNQLAKASNPTRFERASFFKLAKRLGAEKVEAFRARSVCVQLTAVMGQRSGWVYNTQSYVKNNAGEWYLIESKQKRVFY